MKKKFLLITLADIVIVIMVISFCFIYNAKKYEHVQVLPLYLTLDLDQVEYHLGQPIIANITIENVSNRPLLFNARMALDDPTFGDRQLAFHIITPNGKPYQLTGYITYQAIHSTDFITLNPGETIKHTYELNGNGSRYKFTEIGVYHLP